MKRILFVIPRLGGGGAERVVANLVNKLSENKENSVYLNTFIGGKSFYPLSESVKISDCGIKSVKKGFFRKASLLLNFPKAFFKTRKLIKKGNFDAVISFLPEADFTLWLIKKTGVKFRWITSERNDPTHRGKISRFLINKAYKKADFLVCQTERVKEYYSFIGQEKKAVIRNPLNGNNVGVRAENPEKLVVAVGRLYPQKNFPLLINAFSEIHGNFTDYSLKIIGEGTERKKLQKIIDESGAHSYIFLVGAKKDVKEEIKNAELFVMCSDYEGFPNALLEAAAMGIPCVSTDFLTGSAREILPDSEALFPVGDKEALKTVLRKMLSDKEFAENCGANNRENCKRFDMTIIINKWEDVINRVIEKRKIT